MDAIIKILPIRQEHGQRSDGTVVPHYRVDFTVGEDGPFSISVPVEEFNEADLAAYVEAQAALVVGLRSRFTGQGE